MVTTAYYAGFVLMAVSALLLPPLLWRRRRALLWLSPLCALACFLLAVLPLMLTTGQGGPWARITHFLGQDWILALVLPALLLLATGVLHLILALVAAHRLPPPERERRRALAGALLLLCAAPALIVVFSLLPSN